MEKQSRQRKSNDVNAVHTIADLTPEQVDCLRVRIERNTAEPDADGHRIWQGETSDFGHGRVYAASGWRMYAHRALWELTYGPIDDAEAQVHHRCEVPGCMTIEHLVLALDGASHRFLHRRTECPDGHALVGDNVIQISERRPRVCRTCWIVEHPSSVFAGERRTCRSGRHVLVEVGTRRAVSAWRAVVRPRGRTTPARARAHSGGRPSATRRSAPGSPRAESDRASAASRAAPCTSPMAPTGAASAR